MEFFENVLKLDFKEKYKEYCFTIRNNLISALYDIEFLKNINPYTARHKILESSSFKLLDHFISLFWQDLILSTTKLLETDGDDIKSFNRFRNEIKLNAISNIQISKMKLDDELVKKIKKCRTQIIAHNLFNENEFKMQVSEIEPIISSVLQLFNNLQFQVDNINYSLSDEEIQHIKANCINGIKGLLKLSIFGNI